MKVRYFGIIKNIIIILLITGVFSCTNVINELNIDKTNIKDLPDFAEPNSGLRNILHHNDTLIISVEFSECGEWGGHIEKLFLTRNMNNIIIGQLNIDSISCENIKEFGNYSDIDDNTRVIVKTKETELNLEEEKLINLFIHRIVELTLNQEFIIDTVNGEEIIPIFKDSETNIMIKNTESTIKINYRNIGNNVNTFYRKVRNEIFEVN